MLVLLAGIFVVHIATVIMLFVSTIANVWVVSNHGATSVGLWKNCSYNSCNETLSYAGEDALKTVQAFMILSIIFSVIALLVFVFQLFTMEKGNRFFLSGATTLVCFVMRSAVKTSKGRSVTMAIPTSWPGSASASASSSAFSIWS
ncbi:EMP1 isoform 7 [Pongo abelii]|uniref:Epithelial membrane protein 1 n=1 Tax=Pongo abelii TaxID=9601 RepID=A0A2J8SQX5_PONAB|nr:EMP1 isoform 7 [Pongo abelii]